MKLNSISLWKKESKCSRETWAYCTYVADARWCKVIRRTRRLVGAGNCLGLIWRQPPSLAWTMACAGVFRSTALKVNGPATKVPHDSLSPERANKLNFSLKMVRFGEFWVAFKNIPLVLFEGLVKIYTTQYRM